MLLEFQVTIHPCIESHPLSDCVCVEVTWLRDVINLKLPRNECYILNHLNHRPSTS